jgi:Flp pilus assembly protein TadD
MVETLVALDENAGYFLERHNHSSDSEKSPKDYVVRLFPNRPSYRYRGRVHETIDASIQAGGGRLHKTAVRIDHTFSRDHLEMFREATEIADRIARVKPLDPRAHVFVGLYHLLHQPDLLRARADFIQALKLRPGYAEAESFLQLINEREQARLAMTMRQ